MRGVPDFDGIGVAVQALLFLGIHIQQDRPDPLPAQHGFHPSRRVAHQMDELGIGIGVKDAQDVGRLHRVDRALIQQDFRRTQRAQMFKHIADRPVLAIDQPLLGGLYGLNRLRPELQLRQRAQQPVAKHVEQHVIGRLIGPIMHRVADEHVQFGRAHDTRMLAQHPAKYGRIGFRQGQHKDRLRGIRCGGQRVHGHYFNRTAA